jgi:O-antigen/teichoic acid export membrane protein
MSFKRFVRGGVWLYIGSLLSEFLGFLYWVIASRFVDPSVVGSASAVIALQGIFLSMASIGLPTGVRRLIGQTYGKKQYQQLSTYFSTSLVITFTLYIPLAFAVLFVALAGFNGLHITPLELFFLALLLLASFLPPLFDSLFISVLRTRITALAQITSSLAKMSVGVLLLMLGLGFPGVMLGFAIAFLAADFILILCAIRLFKELDIGFKFRASFSGELLKASAPSWIPSVLTILGQSVGILLIYAFFSGTQTALYYVAFAISLIIYNLMISFQTLIFPVLSGMGSGREAAVSRAIRLTLALGVPAAYALAVYASLPLSLLGASYSGAYLPIQLLALGAIAYPIFSVYYSYIYALGKYRQVTVVGVATNVSRLVLYPLLIIPLQSTGAAISYIAGTFAGVFSCVLSARRLGYHFGWIDYGKTLVIPTSAAFVLWFLRIDWFIGVPLLLVASLISYTRLGIVTKKDLYDIAQAFLSDQTLSRITVHSKPIARLLYGSQRQSS